MAVHFPGQPKLRKASTVQLQQELTKAQQKLEKLKDETGSEAEAAREHLRGLVARLQESLGFKSATGVPEQPQGLPQLKGKVVWGDAKPQGVWCPHPSEQPEGSERIAPSTPTLPQETHTAALMRQADWGMRNVTPAFQSAFANARRGVRTLPPDANKYVYLVVPGSPDLSKYGTHYMTATYRHLRENLGLTVEHAGSVASPSDVSKKIKEIARTGKQVVLIGHENGGANIHQALCEDLEVRQHVRAVVSMQAPIAAPLVLGVPTSQWQLNYGLSSREKALRSSEFPLEIPTVSYRYSDVRKTDAKSWAFATDLVPFGAQRIPGTMDVVEEGTEPFLTVFDNASAGPRVEALITTALTNKNPTPTTD